MPEINNARVTESTLSYLAIQLMHKIPTITKYFPAQKNLLNKNPVYNDANPVQLPQSTTYKILQ